MKNLLHCSFCGKSERHVNKLAAGPAGIHICDECVAACQLIMHGDSSGVPSDFDPSTWPTERLLEVVAPVNQTIDAHRNHLQVIIDTLRTRDVSWAKIAEPLGISRQTAWERFGGR